MIDIVSRSPLKSTELNGGAFVVGPWMMKVCCISLALVLYHIRMELSVVFIIAVGGYRGRIRLRDIVFSGKNSMTCCHYGSGLGGVRNSKFYVCARGKVLEYGTRMNRLPLEYDVL
jgi:hypothetical protein